MPINVCHISLGYTCFRIPQSDHSVDPAAIATGASWSGSYCNIPKCQLFSPFLTITNKHIRVNTDVLIQIPPCHHTPILGQKTERKETCSGLRGTDTAFPSDWPISWGEGIKTSGLSWRILNPDPLFKLDSLFVNQLSNDTDKYLRIMNPKSAVLKVLFEVADVNWFKTSSQIMQ